METLDNKSGLNEIQISLLRMFDKDIPMENVLEVKNLIVDYLSQKLLDNVDSIVEEKGISKRDYDNLDIRPYRTLKNGQSSS